MDELRQAIREARKASGLSQEKLAALARISMKTINRFETGIVDLQGASLVSILEVLGFTITPPDSPPAGAKPKPADPLEQMRRDIEENRRLAESALMLAARRGGEEERKGAEKPGEGTAPPALPLDLGRRV